MELRHLRYFLALAEELHFGRAAKRLSISQPPLSRQIRQTEEELGVPLFTRSKRRVALTPAGRVMLVRARAVLDEADALSPIVRQAHRGEIGRLVVGFVHSAGYGLMPPVVREFRRLCPDVKLVLRERIFGEQLDDLRAGRIDVGLLRPPVGDQALVTETIWREPFVAALPAGHPLSGQGPLRLKALARQPFILFPRERSAVFHDQIQTLCRKAGFVPAMAQETNTIHTALGLVGAGIGVALVPASVRRIGAVDVTFRSLVEARPQAELALAWKRDESNPVLARFLGVARDVARDEGQRSRSRVVGNRSHRERDRFR